MIPEFTEDQYAKLTDLLKTTKEYPVFVFDDLLIDAEMVSTVKLYVKENPSIKFRTWLIDKGLVIKEIDR